MLSELAAIAALLAAIAGVAYFSTPEVAPTGCRDKSHQASWCENAYCRACDK